MFTYLYAWHFEISEVVISGNKSCSKCSDDNIYHRKWKAKRSAAIIDGYGVYQKKAYRQPKSLHNFPLVALLAAVNFINPSIIIFEAGGELLAFCY